MMSARKYFLWTVSVLIPFWVLVSWFVLTTPPYVGDMTRIGGYSETDFAPRAPQLKFKDPCFTKAAGLADYDQPYDVLVIGDSFTQNTDHGWQSFLAQKTGLSIITFHESTIDFKRLVAHEQYIKTPPKIVIFEIVEHGLHGFRFSCDPINTPAESSDKIPIQLQLHPHPLNLVSSEKPAERSLEIEHGMHRLKRLLSRWTGSSEKVFQVALDSSSFFSCRRSDHALLYHGDFWKNTVSRQQWNDVREQLLALQTFMEHHGDPLFILMVANDKSTIYRDHIIDPPMPILSGVERLEDTSKLHILPLQEALQRRISTPGIKDVYLSNDTHWGLEGHTCAADVVFNYLENSPRVNLK